MPETYPPKREKPWRPGDYLPQRPVVVQPIEDRQQQQMVIEFTDGEKAMLAALHELRPLSFDWRWWLYGTWDRA